jgi:hypothetical protein
MISISSDKYKKIKRRNFFYYIGAAAVGSFVLSKFPFNFLKKNLSTKSHSSIKVTENPFAVKRTHPPGTRGKGPLNG